MEASRLIKQHTVAFEMPELRVEFWQIILLFTLFQTDSNRTKGRAIARAVSR
jgi:hypothetical protein